MSYIHLSVIVPVYNEVLVIGQTITKLRGFLENQLYSWEILVCDDGSTDDTLKTLYNQAINLNNVRILQLPHKGKGSAIRSGVLSSNGKYIFMCDADLSMSVDQIPIFLHKMNNSEIDIVIGSRQIEGSVRIGESWGRHFMGRVFNKLVKLILVGGYQDSQCGYKCFSSESATHLISNQRIDGWAFDAEILFLAQKFRYQVSEIPIEWHHRSNSKVRVISSSFSMLIEIIKVKILDKFGRYHF